MLRAGPVLEDDMTTTRRDFLSTVAIGVAGAAVVPKRAEADSLDGGGATAGPVPGAPPAFGTSPAVGPKVSPATFAEAEKLVQAPLNPADRAQAASNWRTQVAYIYERRTGPKKLALEDGLAPAAVWNPVLPGMKLPTRSDRFLPSKVAAPALPQKEADIAFAPLPVLAAWLQSRALTSVKLTELYLSRLERFQKELLCTITLTRDLALTQARAADAELAAGKIRGPLHGIPYGLKDLLDTAGVPTTYGAEPFRNRVPEHDAPVVSRLREAGAVLVAKLSLGALALNDVWFGGQTKNPWLREEGSSGSSAGPGSATAAGLVGFSIGSETMGSIVSPSMRCGVTGLRPTFGRVPRTGAMTLCWSLDKLGPIARGVEDTLLVLHAINGADAGDVASVSAPLEHDASAPVAPLRVGYFPRWMTEAPATPVDRAALDAVRALGMKTAEVTLPDWPYGSLDAILFSEAAAAFEELTLTHGLDALKMQVADAWPNLFRQARFISAVDLVQADRMRRKVAMEMARLFEQVDVLLVPSLRPEMLAIANYCGHPSLTLRAGFVEVGEVRSDWAPDPKHPPQKLNPRRRVPHGVTLVGRLFEEGALCRAGMALEGKLGVAAERPPGFD
jgi:Asp-tRNA(Asn)/Glu-tRNA(Gln) amidotransferase A subunit family amidase